LPLVNDGSVFDHDDARGQWHRTTNPEFVTEAISSPMIVSELFKEKLKPAASPNRSNEM